MFRIRLAPLILLACAASVFPRERNYVAWLIYWGVKDSPAIELPTQQGPWRIVRRDGSLLVEMPQPALKPGYTFNFGECRIDGLLRQDLIAMVKHTPTVEWSTEVSVVWIADPKEKKFVRRGGSGVQCRNEGYGV